MLIVKSPATAYFGTDGMVPFEIIKKKQVYELVMFFLAWICRGELEDSATTSKTNEVCGYKVLTKKHV